MLPPSRPSSWVLEVDGLGLPLLEPVPSDEPPPVALGAADRSVRDESVASELAPRWRPVPSGEGGCGSSERSGSTSSSMASKTELTWRLTSPSCTGSRSRRAPQASRCDWEKAERAWMGPRESGSRS